MESTLLEKSTTNALITLVWTQENFWSNSTQRIAAPVVGEAQACCTSRTALAIASESAASIALRFETAQDKTYLGMQ